MDDKNRQSNQGSWRVRSAQPAAPPGNRTQNRPPSAAPQLTNDAEPFHVTRIPKSPQSYVQRQPSNPEPAKSVQSNSTTKAATNANTNVTINISMPKLKKPPLPRWPWRKIAVYGAVLAGLIVASIIIRLVIVHVMEQRALDKAKNRLDTVQPSPNQPPTFKPVVPKDSAVAQTANYDSTKQSYSYADTFKGAEVTISQQPLPGGSVTTVAKAAKSLDATTPLVLEDGTAYLATTVKTGGQVVVLGRGEVLVFIQSPITHSQAEWKSYLDNLATT